MKATNGRSNKRSKCERQFDLDWLVLPYQSNSFSLEDKFSKELSEGNQHLVPIMNDAYNFNAELEIIRNRMRKQTSQTYLKKALIRGAFNITQSFNTISYKPNNSFIKYFNQIEKHTGSHSKEEKKDIEEIGRAHV